LPGPAIIDETVRVAKKYLEEHPEEINGIGCSMEQEVKELSVHGRLTIIGAEICITFFRPVEERSNRFIAHSFKVAPRGGNLFVFLRMLFFLHYKKRTCRDWWRQVLAERRKTY